MNIYKMKKLLIPFTISLLFTGCNTQQQHNSTEQTNETPQEVIEEENTNEDLGKLPMEYVEMTTDKGKIVIELDPNAAPVSVANFLSYVDDGFYNGTIFHRVIPNFMIQGGGITPDGNRKETKQPIILESDNGLSNTIGTIAMARTGAPNSATAQFYINVANNTNLDYRPGNPGYAVFGKVIEGMDVVNEIRQVPTGVKNGRPNWPKEDVLIQEVKRVE